jgi:hypothetical protein
MQQLGEGARQVRFLLLLLLLVVVVLGRTR